jgi:hypothetical protein
LGVEQSDNNRILLRDFDGAISERGVTDIRLRRFGQPEKMAG